jgi:hypothetical protein
LTLQVAWKDVHNQPDVLLSGCTLPGSIWWNQVRPKYKQWDNIPFQIPTENRDLSEFLELVADATNKKITVGPKSAPASIARKQFAFPKSATFWCADVQFNRQTALGLPFSSLPSVSVLLYTFITLVRY